MGDRYGTSKAKATFMSTGNQAGGEMPEVNMQGARVDIAARNNLDRSGNHEAEAAFIEGKAKVSAQKADISIAAGQVTEDLQMKEMIVYLSKILDTLPQEVVEKLAKELRNDFGIYAVKDLKDVEAKDLENDLKAIKHVQKKKFLRHVQELKKIQH